MDKDTRLLQAEILRTRGEVDTIATDIDAINDDIVLINTDIQALDTLTSTHTADISALQADTAAQGQRIGTLETRADDTDAAIHTLDMDVERIDADVSNANSRIDDLEYKEDARAYFLGAFRTTAELLAFPTPSQNDFADNYGTSTRWIFTDGAWSNTNEQIPTDATILGNTAPLMDGSASAGTATTASRVDHVHPSDTSRVPTSRTVNGKPLTGNIALTAADIANAQRKMYLHCISNMPAVGASLSGVYFNFTVLSTKSTALTAGEVNNILLDMGYTSTDNGSGGGTYKGQAYPATGMRVYSQALNFPVIGVAPRTRNDLSMLAISVDGRSTPVIYSDTISSFVDRIQEVI